VGIASLVLGIIAILMTCLGGRLMGFALGILGLILGLVAKSGRKKGTPGREIAVAGVILNLIVVAIMGILVLLVLAGVGAAIGTGLML
jgi:hypothetical protein